MIDSAMSSCRILRAVLGTCVVISHKKNSHSLAAHHLLGVEGLGKGGERGVVHTTAQAEHHVEGRLLPNTHETVSTTKKALHASRHDDSC